ncbi:hypothetical protein NXF25_012269 [Crotalus adamanteus]|uniref:Uncharacterized protein n=1 Tax=Crotalus adamanteus TaxID=8729 RepID=A0AAW1BHE2_CROAD
MNGEGYLYSSVSVFGGGLLLLTWGGQSGGITGREAASGEICGHLCRYCKPAFRSEKWADNI